MIAGWLLAGYVVLETLPWTRTHLQSRRAAQRAPLLLSAMGLAIALVVATAALRWRSDEDAATDTVS